MRYSTLTARVGGSAEEAWAVHELAATRAARGEDVIVLSIGEPDFPPPAVVVESAIAGLRAGRTRYTASAGDGDLRAAAAAHTAALVGRPIDPARVVAFPGAQSALFAACLCIAETGDEVLVPEPAYVTYGPVVGASGATAVPVPLRPDRGFHVDPADVQARVGPRTRAILLNTPQNPTGAVLTRDGIAALGAIARQHDLWLLSDEVYAALVFEGRHASPLGDPDLEERTCVVSSVSKSHAMTGFRLGWAVGPLELARHLENLAACMLFGTPRFVQDAARTALEQAGDEAARMCEAYRRRAALVVDALDGTPGVRCHRPEGGMFVMLDVRATGMDGETFARDLLDAVGVGTLPGEGFGPSAAGHVRIGLGAPDEVLADACARIATYVRSLVSAV